VETCRHHFEGNTFTAHYKAEGSNHERLVSYLVPFDLTLRLPD